MEISKTVDGENMTMTVTGRLDAVTSPQFDAEVANLPEAVKNLVFDFARLDYISSAGLRVIVSAYKVLRERAGSVRVDHANATVLNVLKLTGMTSVIGIG